MNQLALKKSTLMKKRYHIDTFPIPLWQIEQAIIDQGFDIVITKKLCKSCVIRNSVYIPHTYDSTNRVLLSHELGHILCHNCDIHRLDKSTMDQYELYIPTSKLHLHGHFDPASRRMRSTLTEAEPVVTKC